MSELNQLPLQLVNLPKNQLNALQGESLTLFRFEQLDTEVFAYFQLLKYLLNPALSRLKALFLVSEFPVLY